MPRPRTPQCSPEELSSYLGERIKGRRPVLVGPEQVLVAFRECCCSDTVVNLSVYLFFAIFFSHDTLLLQWSPSQDSGVTPNSSPSPTRRFRPAVSAVRWPPLAPLKRKGGVESDGPPKKLFVAGVTEPSHRSSYTLSVSPPSDDSPPLSAPQSPSFTSFSPHQH